jgi:hypothetical protein
MFVKSHRLTNPNADPHLLHCPTNFSYVVTAFVFIHITHISSLLSQTLFRDYVKKNVSQKLAELKLVCSRHSWLINQSILYITLCFPTDTHAMFYWNIHCYIPIYSLVKLLLYQQCNRHLFCLSCYSPSLSHYIFRDRCSVSQIHSSIQTLVFIQY